MDDLLDDPAALEGADPGGMLRAVASGAAQVREAAALSVEAGLARLSGEDLPRSVVVLGSALAGDALRALAGAACPVPVVTHAGFGLPTWVGAADLVVAVSASGTAEETLSTGDEAARRGSRLLVVGAPGSPLEALAVRGRALFVPVHAQGRPSRACFFALMTPVVIAADALGLLSCPAEEVEATAVLLETLAGRNRPNAETVLNPAKSLALGLHGQLPVVWGSSPLAGVSAYRFACQLSANSKLPAMWGVLPEAGRHQLAAFDGPFAGGPKDIFADPFEDDAPARTRMHLVLLRDTEEHPDVARHAVVVRDLARGRGLDVSELVAEGLSPFQRFASLVALADWASTYLALAEGTDPTTTDAVSELKDALPR